MIIFASYASSEQIESTLTAKTVLNYIVLHSMYSGLILIIFVSFIQSYASTPLIKKIFLNCLKISEMSQREFGYRMDYRDLRQKFFKSLIVVVAIGSLSDVTLMTFLYFFDVFSLKPMLIAYAPISYSWITAVKFTFYVRLISYQLETILELLPRIFKGPTELSPSSELFLLSVRPKPSSDITSRIKSLRKMLNIVYENCELVNRAVGATVLTIVVVTVIAITALGR
jgi:hypothetical protein